MVLAHLRAWWIFLKTCKKYFSGNLDFVYPQIFILRFLFPLFGPKLFGLEGWSRLNKTVPVWDTRTHVPKLIGGEKVSATHYHNEPSLLKSKPSKTSYTFSRNQTFFLVRFCLGYFAAVTESWHSEQTCNYQTTFRSSKTFFGCLIVKVQNNN